MRTVLVVDDSPSMRNLVGTTMRTAGFSVVEAGDGSAALSAVHGIRVDLVITDLNMPVMDGITMVQQLRKLEHFKYTPILLLTTESNPQQKARARSAGATGWLTKPFEPKQLVATVQRVLP